MSKKKRKRQNAVEDDDVIGINDEGEDAAAAADSEQSDDDDIATDSMIKVLLHACLIPDARFILSHVISAKSLVDASTPTVALLLIIFESIANTNSNRILH